MVVTTLQAVGRRAISGVAAVGRGGQLALGAVRALRKFEVWGPLFLPQLFAVGVASVPIALFIAAFTGVVLAIQASYTFTGTVPLYFVGALVGKTIILELGPVLTGLALAGRVGANIAAELGTMRVTEQIDALESLAYDPVAYLVVPRVLAGLIMVPLVVGLSIAMGIAAGWITSLFLLDLSTPQFVRGLRLFFEPFDVTFALIKAASFGLIVTGIGAFFGFTTRGGAAGVGLATTRAVVGASMLILVLDAFWAAALL
ncbi:MAG: ABC transporter permease [Gemmatimonadetes bacterium]|nr:ABC transporter permease [Gemmatimonadota bacterium]MBT8405399.1 ABC transporter permease [Gemmatimonadota bacterium]NNF37823.1 ABC transporter permease [Gemmatimonadota bacterium]NNK64448.1 ABC transporter permease [Gemmatimonadota bacterium]